MSAFSVTVPGGESRRLKTGGKYCPADIVVTAEDNFEAGQDALWDALQRGNEEYIYYGYAFANRDIWTQANIEKVKHKVLKANYYSVVFSGNTSITDLSMFRFAERYNVYGELARETYSSTFSGCTNLVKSMTINLDTVGSCPNMFNNCSSLVELPVTGTLSVNGLVLSSCTKLNRASILGIINALKDHSGTGTTMTVTIGADNLAKLTDEEKAIATQKGWTLA